MVNKRRREEASAGAWRVTKRISEFYVLLATQFSLRRRQIRPSWTLRRTEVLLSFEDSYQSCMGGCLP